MKKQVKKMTLKTDKIVSLTKNQAQNLAGGRRGYITKEMPESNDWCND
jgi:hypothetical protein